MTQHQSVGAPFGIKGFPTIKIFGYNKQKPIDYNGQRTADAMGDEAFKQLRKLTKVIISTPSSFIIVFRTKLRVANRAAAHPAAGTRANPARVQ